MELKILSDSLENIYRKTREQSLAFCAPLQSEDYSLQGEAFASPPSMSVIQRHCLIFMLIFLS